MDRWLSGLRTPLVVIAATTVAAPGAAHASARLVLTSTESQVAFFVDGTPLVASMGGGQMRTTLTPGPHVLQVRDERGEIIYSGQIDMPSSEEVGAEWTRMGGLRIVWPERLADPASRPAPVPPVVEQNSAPGDDPALDRVQDDRGVHQASGSGPQRAGGTGEFGRMGRAATDRLLSPTGTGTTKPTDSGDGGVRQQASSAVISRSVGVVRSPTAGGIGGSRSSDARQGRPTPVAAVVGSVRLDYSGENPVVVYADGSLIAELAGGAPTAQVVLEVGVHEIEVRSTDFGLLHHGMLEIEQDFTVDLMFGPDQPAAATNRDWLWSPR